MKLKNRLLLALTASLSMGWAASSHATPIAYMLSPDVTGSGPASVTYTVSATFDWDSTTNLESNVNIVVTGAGPYAGTYTDTPALITEVKATVPDNKDACGENAVGNICVRFIDALGSVPDSLSGIWFGNVPGDLDAPATGMITGDAAAVLATAAPEPASLVLLGTGLLGFGALRRRTGA